MDVETVDEQSISLSQIAFYVGLTASFLLVALLPALLSWSYIRALKTVILLVILSQIVRLMLSALLSVPESAEPPAFEGDEWPVVSIIIPAYNEAAVLPETIEACRDLDYPDEKLEFFVSYEESCTDDTGAIAERAADTYDNFEALVGPGEGKAQALNDALDHVTGDIVVNIDADHRFKPDALERAVRWLAAEEDTWCVKGRCYGRNPTDSLVALYATVDRHLAEKVELFARQVFGGFTLFGGGQVFFRREVFEEFGGYDPEMLVEDIDLSARIHAHGKDLRIDPNIITYEEQPATLKAWWTQRKRWARGWLQVSARYIDDFVRSRASLTAKADAAQTFSYNLMLPFLVVGIPLPLLDVMQSTGLISVSTTLTAYLPYSRVLWTVLGLFPVFALACVFYSDRRDGLDHHPHEYVAAFTIGFYFFVNTAVYVVAFIEEFVLQRPHVFVVTSRSGDDDE
jgi:cellulose synthase/poly-beta-1,6-N-acetylglucosamine synthase-like glycosyltransferase